MAGQLTVVRFNIASAGTTSNEQDMRAYKLVALYVPTLTSTAVTFLGRPLVGTGADGLARQVFDDAGVAVTATVSSNRYISFAGAGLALIQAVAYLSLVAGTTEAAAREIIGVCEPRGV